MVVSKAGTLALNAETLFSGTAIFEGCPTIATLAKFIGNVSGSCILQVDGGATLSLESNATIFFGSAVALHGGTFAVTGTGSVVFMSSIVAAKGSRMVIGAAAVFAGPLLLDECPQLTGGLLTVQSNLSGSCYLAIDRGQELSLSPASASTVYLSLVIRGSLSVVGKGTSSTTFAGAITAAAESHVLLGSGTVLFASPHSMHLTKSANFTIATATIFGISASFDTCPIFRAASVTFQSDVLSSDLCQEIELPEASSITISPAALSGPGVRSTLRLRVFGKLSTAGSVPVLFAAPLHVFAAGTISLGGSPSFEVAPTFDSCPRLAERCMTTFKRGMNGTCTAIFVANMSTLVLDTSSYEFAFLPKISVAGTFTTVGKSRVTMLSPFVALRGSQVNLEAGCTTYTADVSGSILAVLTRTPRV